MNFEKEKKEFLRKKDKSKKGSMDNKIKKLVNKINSLDKFYTTSSCSGRVLLLVIPQSNKKNKVQYLFCSHKKIKHNNIKKILKTIITKIKFKKIKNNVWFKIEPVILHVACENINNAKKFLNTARDIGFRRSGIISIRKDKIIMELISTEKIETIISKNGKLLIDENYFSVLVKEGNKKLENTWEKIKKLYNKTCTIKFNTK